eukprot:433860-Pelagomonas_calceolata.AAC.1
MQLRYFDLKAPHVDKPPLLISNRHMTQYPETDYNLSILWEHLHKCQMPIQLIFITKDLYQDDNYILIDGDKRASVQSTHG